MSEKSLVFGGKKTGNKSFFKALTQLHISVQLALQYH